MRFTPLTPVNLLNELSFNDLKQSTDSNFETDRESNTHSVSISFINYIPAVQNRTLLAEGTATTKNGKYTVRIQVDGVDIKTEPFSGSVEINYSGQTYYIQPISMNIGDVKVSCECMDFYMRFAFFNFNANALYGERPTPYQGKGKRGPVNPASVPGICKHIRALGYKLKEDGVLN
jgi:hypothetical protein